MPMRLAFTLLTCTSCVLSQGPVQQDTSRWAFGLAVFSILSNLTPDAFAPAALAAGAAPGPALLPPLTAMLAKSPQQPFGSPLATSPMAGPGFRSPVTPRTPGASRRPALTVPVSVSARMIYGGATNQALKAPELLAKQLNVAPGAVGMVNGDYPVIGSSVQAGVAALAQKHFFTEPTNGASGARSFALEMDRELVQRKDLVRVCRRHGVGTDVRFTMARSRPGAATFAGRMPQAVPTLAALRIAACRALPVHTQVGMIQAPIQGLLDRGEAWSLDQLANALKGSGDVCKMASPTMLREALIMVMADQDGTFASASAEDVRTLAEVRTRMCARRLARGRITCAIAARCTLAIHVWVSV